MKYALVFLMLTIPDYKVGGLSPIHVYDTLPLCKAALKRVTAKLSTKVLKPVCMSEDQLVAKMAQICQGKVDKMETGNSASPILYVCAK